MRAGTWFRGTCGRKWSRESNHLFSLAQGGQCAVDLHNSVVWLCFSLGSRALPTGRCIGALAQTMNFPIDHDHEWTTTLFWWHKSLLAARSAVLSPTAPHVTHVFSKGSAAPCCTTHTGSPSVPLSSAKVFSSTPTIAVSVTCTHSQEHMCRTVTFVADAVDIGPAMLATELSPNAVLHDECPT